MEMLRYFDPNVSALQMRWLAQRNSGRWFDIASAATLLGHKYAVFAAIIAGIYEFSNRDAARVKLTFFRAHLHTLHPSTGILAKKIGILLLILHIRMRYA
jgi:hypothetical protein